MVTRKLVIHAKFERYVIYTLPRYYLHVSNTDKMKITRTFLNQQQKRKCTLQYLHSVLNVLAKKKQTKRYHPHIYCHKGKVRAGKVLVRILAKCLTQIVTSARIKKRQIMQFKQRTFHSENRRIVVYEQPGDERTLHCHFHLPTHWKRYCESHSGKSNRFLIC